MKEFHLQIVTPDGLAFDGKAESLLAKTDEGDVEILANHMDYFATLGIGKARIKMNGKEKFASVGGGFLSVSKNSVKLVATTFELADNIDLNRARAAKEKAENAISNSNDEKYIALAKAKLARALNRINVAELSKTR